MRKITKSDYQYGWNDKIVPILKVKKGLSPEIIKQISSFKKEPLWMKEFRLKAYDYFLGKKMPTWGPDLSEINFEEIYFYLKPTKDSVNDWNKVPREIRNTYEKLGVPQAERKFLAGVEAQFDSEMVYGNLKKELSAQGIIFMDTDSALKEHPALFKEYFGTVVPSNDNKFSALNSSVWSGGSFIYIPKGVKVKLPLQAYFRINAQKMGQFERTLIIADEGSFVNYIEGCTSPVYSTDSLHAAVVEIIVKKNARVRYTTIQNWSNNVYNLVTKRAKVFESGLMEWVDCNLGSKVTMKYPSCFLIGKKAKAEILSLAFAGKGQTIDSGGKIYQFAPETSGTIISKSVSKDGGSSSYRGLVFIQKGAINSKSKVKCDALILDKDSRADTFPHIKINENQVSATHEAMTGRLNEDQLFYLQSRGLDEARASSLLVNGFIEPIAKELPMEYAIELNRLVQLEMQGSIG